MNVRFFHMEKNTLKSLLSLQYLFFWTNIFFLDKYLSPFTCPWASIQFCYIHTADGATSEVSWTILLSNEFVQGFHRLEKYLNIKDSP